VLRRIFGPKTDEIVGNRRKLHSEELHKLYPSSSIIRMIKSRRMRWAGNVTRMWERRNACRALVGKTEAWRPLGRPSHRCEDNIKMNLIEIGWGGMYWIDLAEGGDRWSALVNTVVDPRVP
jgi:hypothetical protein